MRNTVTSLRYLIIMVAVLCWAQLKAQTSKTTEPERIIIKNVNLWDGISDDLKEDRSVLIEGNLIREVGVNLSVEEVDLVIDGQGQTLIPGLSDAHVHLTFTMPVRAYGKTPDTDQRN